MDPQNELSLFDLCRLLVCCLVLWFLFAQLYDGLDRLFTYLLKLSE